jgi:hypothetical protein
LAGADKNGFVYILPNQPKKKSTFKGISSEKKTKKKFKNNKKKRISFGRAATRDDRV